MEIFLKGFFVFLGSTIKFFLGPLLGVGYELPLLLIILLTIVGMMTTVYLVTYFGESIRKFFFRVFNKKKKFTARNRRFVKLWQKYGIIGVSFLTPLLLTPPIGSLLINALGGKKSEIIKWMWISACINAVVITLTVKYAFWAINSFV